MPKNKIHAVMGEYKRGTLRSGGGGKVASRAQAVAIALSEARKAGAKIPKKRKKRTPGRSEIGDMVSKHMGSKH